MSKSGTLKLLAAFSGSAILVTGAITTAVAGDNNFQTADEGAEQHAATHRVLTGGAITYKQASTTTDWVTTSSTQFVNVPFAVVRVPIAAGKSGLINVRFTAESSCNEGGGAGEQGVCEVRVLIGGVEGYPQNAANPPSVLAFDSTGDGTESPYSWESHSTESHRCYTNRTTATVSVPVVVQWRVSNLGADADVPTFWLDDLSLVAERSDNCTG